MNEPIFNEASSSIDPLLECLLFIAKSYGNNVSPNVLTAGLPLVNGRLTPALVLRAASRLQFKASIIERKLEAIHTLVLPVILVLNNNQACVLQNFYADGMGDFVFPGVNEIQRVSLTKIQEIYSGLTLYVKPEYAFEDRADEYHVEKTETWFWGTLWQYRRNYYDVALAAVLINIFVIASPLFAMNVYDRVVPNQTLTTLWVLAIGISIIYLFDLIFKTIRGYLIDVTGKKADLILSSIMFEHLLSLRMEAKPASAGAFANNFHGFESVRDFFSSATLVSFIDLPFILIFITIIGCIGGFALAAVPLLAIPIVVIISFILQVPIRKSTEESYVGAAQKNAIIVESVNALETIKVTSSEGGLQHKWEHYTSQVAKAGMKSRFYSSLTVNITSYILQMTYVIMIVVGVYEILSGDLTMGGLIACSILSSRTLAPLTQVASLITRLHQAKTGLKALNRVMALPSESKGKTTYLHRPRLNGDIEFQNVGFKYPEEQSLALNNVSFKIKSQEKVAILGRVGSGKSSALKLILNLYQVQSGAVFLDNTDIGQIDPADIRRNIGYVSQDNMLFYGSLRDNITKSAPLANHQDILRVANIAGIGQFAQQNPKGFDLMIGESGVGLSAGQRQSIAIARALLPNPPILIFDEPTSNFDDNSEKALVHHLKELIKDKTFILVTHKISMLELVDRIIIFSNNRVVADGPKDEILKKLSQ